MYEEFEEQFLAPVAQAVGANPALARACRDIARAAWGFEWTAQPGAAVALGLRPDGIVQLSLTTWVTNTDEPDDEELHPLVSSVPVSPVIDGPRQIRQLVHWWLTHEADEQLVFAGRRLFYPHDDQGRVRQVG